MADNQQGEKLFGIDFSNARTVGEYRSLVSLQTGIPVDELGIADSFANVIYNLPDHVAVPSDPYVFVLKPQAYEAI